MSMMDAEFDCTAYGLKAGTHPEETLQVPEATDNGRATVSTMAPNVGPPYSVDDEVLLRPRDRISDRVTGFGSLDRSMESRLATPGDFRLPSTTKENYTVGGLSFTVLCDARAEKSHFEVSSKTAGQFIILFRQKCE